MKRDRHGASAFRHLPGLIVLQGLVVAVLLVAWIRASSEPLARDHEAWLNLGIGAVTVSGVINAGFLMESRKAVSLRRAELYGTACTGAAVPQGLASVGGPQRAPRLAASAAMTRYHRPTCALVSGKAVELQRQSEHEAAGRRPCGVCRP